VLDPERPIREADVSKVEISQFSKPLTGCSTVRYAVTDAWLSHAIQWRVTMRMRFKDALCVIPIGRILLAAAASGAVLATNALAQSDASPYVAIENERPPKLTVDPTPLAAGLAHDIVWIQYHAENVRIVPVFGTGALNVISTDRASARAHRRPALGLGGSDG